MMINATHLQTCAVRLKFAAAGGLLVLAGPLLAAQDKDEVVKGRGPDAMDVATTPLTDLNLARDEIPEVLLLAAATPYGSQGLGNCDAITQEIAGLDRVLGDDLDIDTGQRRDITLGKIAKSAVSSFIPFRGIIRELSGAADHQRNFEEAIFAGAVRRGYLKGLGEQKGCPYPARPAFTKVEVSKDAPAAEDRKGEVTVDQGTGTADVIFVTNPVVQQAPQ